jgi:hypothetical protein
MEKTNFFQIFGASYRERKFESNPHLSGSIKFALRRGKKAGVVVNIQLIKCKTAGGGKSYASLLQRGRKPPFPSIGKLSNY